MIFRCKNTALSLAVTAALLLFPLLPAAAVTLDEAMAAALENDSSLADAGSRLKIAENNLFKSAPLYGTNLSLTGSLKGGGESAASSGAPGASAADAAVQKSVAANLSVPFAKWLSLGVSGSTDTKTSTGTLSVSLTPFAKADTQAELAWNKAVIDAQNAVRSTMLAVRREYRAVLTTQAEYDWRKAAVRSAQNELSRIAYLVELGNERKSQALTASSDLIDAQGELDAAENNLNIAKQNLSLRTGIAEASLTDFGELAVSESRNLATLDSWIASSAELASAELTLKSALLADVQSIAFPDLSLGTSVADTGSWALTAKVSFSPDVFFQKSKSSASESSAVQQRAFANAERSVRTAWQNQRSSLVMAERNFANATRFMESAKVSYAETELLFERGESSQASLDTAGEKLLSAKAQLQKAVESLENARDSLDESWQLQLN